MHSVVPGAQEELGAPLCTHVTKQISFRVVGRKALQFIVKLIDEIRYRFTRWSVQASHYKWPLASHTYFGPYIFSVYHSRVHQRFGLDGVPYITNDARTMPRAIFTVSYRVPGKGYFV